MRIRTLDQDLNSHQLEVYGSGNGDIYVTVYQNDEHHSARDEYRGMPVTVRVGMAGSGHNMPNSIKKLLWQLAQEFEKYKDCKFETDGSHKDNEDFYKQYQNDE